MHRAVWTVFATSLLVVWLAVAGCKEEEKAPEQPAAGGEAAKAEPAAQPTPEEKAAPGAEVEKAKVEEKAGEEATPAAPVEGEKQASEDLNKKEVPPTVAPAAQLERTLRKVTAWGVTGPIDKTRDLIISLLPPQAQVAAKEQFNKGLADIAKESGLKNLDWLDMSRGVAFGFEGKDKPIFAIPVTDVEAFIQALPDGMQADGNNGYAFGTDAYVMPAGKHLFLSESFRTIDVIEGDLKLELTRMSTDKVAMISVDGESLKTLVSSLLDEAERGMGETMPMQQEQKEFFAKFFNFVRELLGDVEKATLEAEVAGGDLVLRYSLDSVPGSKLAQSIGALRPGNFAAAGLLPAKSYMAMGQNMPPDAVTPWLARYVDLVATAWKLGEEERVEFTKLYARMLQLFGPDSAFAMYSDAGFPMAMTAVSQSSAGLEAREVIYAFYTQLLNKMITNLPAEQQKQFAGRSFRDIMLSLSPVLQNLGIGVKIESEDYRGGKVDFLVFTFDWAKLPAPDWAQTLVGGQLGGALGFDATHVVMTFGPNPIVRAKEVLDGTPGLSVEEFAGPGSTQGRYMAFFTLSIKGLVTDLLQVKPIAEAAVGQDWVTGVAQIDDLRMLCGTEKETVWIEVKIGIQSIVKAFEQPLLKAIEEAQAIGTEG